MLRIAFSTNHPRVRYLLVLLVAAQLLLRLIDRYYLPGYLLRADDESFWLSVLTSYGATGIMDNHHTLEGPGIFYLVALIATPFHLQYDLVLVVLAIIFGSLYVVPAFMLYRVLFEGDERLAFVATLLVSMSDVMIYSMTDARPTLFGLFLIPLAVCAFQKLRGRFNWLTFILLLLISAIMLIFHAPITFVAFLAVVSFTILMFDDLRKWETTFTVLVFSMYGLMVHRSAGLDNIWRFDLFKVFPMNLIAALMGNGFFFIFPISSIGVLALSPLIPRLGNRMMRGRLWWKNSKSEASYILLSVLFLLGAVSVVVLWKDSGYIIAYKNTELFMLLHGWKVAFAIVALYGLKACGARYKRTSNDTSLPWLVSMMVVIVFLAAYTPLTGDPGVWNLDYRFSEFAYYPAFYFVTFGLNQMAIRLTKKNFLSIALPLIALYTIPSIIVGMRQLIPFITPWKL